MHRGASELATRPQMIESTLKWPGMAYASLFLRAAIGYPQTVAVAATAKGSALPASVAAATRTHPASPALLREKTAHSSRRAAGSRLQMFAPAVHTPGDLNGRPAR